MRHETLLNLFRIGAHGTELHHLEQLTVQTHTALQEEDRAAITLNQQSNHQEQRGQQNQTQARSNDVHGALEEGRQAGDARGRHVHQRQTVQRLHVHTGTGDIGRSGSHNQ